jgi:hypothetical protein
LEAISGNLGKGLAGSDIFSSCADALVASSFSAAAAANISGAGYPLFGIANVLLVGPFSYLILIGLYGSAISIAEDTKLRHSIKASMREELNLLAWYRLRRNWRT